MRSRKVWIRAIGVTAVISTILSAAGFGYAVYELLGPGRTTAVPLLPPGNEASAGSESAQQEWADKEQIRITVLGDSLGSGTGDVSGRGIAGQLREQLERRLDKPVFIHSNYAIPGHTTEQLLAAWEAKKDMGQAVSESDLVVLAVGGNDLFAGGQDLFAADSDDLFQPEAAKTRLEPALERLDAIFTRITEAAPSALVMYVGLYHPFLDLDEERQGSLIIQQWNAAAFELTNKHEWITLVPTYDLFERNLNRYLYNDHFHPNEEGYERIASRIAAILD